MAAGAGRDFWLHWVFLALPSAPGDAPGKLGWLEEGICASVGWMRIGNTENQDSPSYQFIHWELG